LHSSARQRPRPRGCLVVRSWLGTRSRGGPARPLSPSSLSEQHKDDSPRAEWKVYATGPGNANQSHALIIPPAPATVAPAVPATVAPAIPGAVVLEVRGAVAPEVPGTVRAAAGRGAPGGRPRAAPAARAGSRPAGRARSGPGRQDGCRTATGPAAP